MKPLDIARVVATGDLCIITQVTPDEDRPTASIEFIGGHTDGCGKSAWYHPHELKVIDSLPLVLARCLTRPGGSWFKIPADLFG